MAFQDVLKKLNEIDVKDLQNIDYKAILISIKKNPLPLIDAVIIILGLVFGVIIYSSRADKIQEASRQVTDMRARLQEYETYNTVKKEYDEYVAKLPLATEESALVKRITSAAGRYDIKILSFPPPVIENQELYSEWEFSLDITAQDFVKLWQFLLDLEAMEKTLWMKSCSLTKNSGGDNQNRRFSRRVSGRVAAAQLSPTDEEALSANIRLVYVAYEKK